MKSIFYAIRTFFSSSKILFGCLSSALLLSLLNDRHPDPWLFWSSRLLLLLSYILLFVQGRQIKHSKRGGIR